jgi:CheY-like chemotaxis protein
MLLEKILGFAGFRCLTACNGLEALEVFDREGPDLILTDISMPIMDGYQTVAAIRARLDGATVPIVAVTAHAMTGDREQAIEQGCTEYLAKPYRPGDLLRVVERLVNKGSS